MARRGIATPVNGWVVIDRIGRVEPGSLAYRKAEAERMVTDRHDVAEAAGSWDYWMRHGYAAVRCQVFVAVPAQRRWLGGLRRKRTTGESATTHPTGFSAASSGLEG